ncbi:MAG: nucleotidyltransferase family protein [Patescibacteria group bacterium]
MSIAEIQEKTMPILRRHGVAEAYVFGSASRGDERADSDVDILVRFNKLNGLFEYMKIKFELEDALGGRRVDLVQMEALRPEFRSSVDRQKVRIV